MKKATVIMLLMISWSWAWSQNSFPLLSSGQYTGGGGDHTAIGTPQLKLVGTTTYPRIVHLSVTSSVSAVYNFETGKNAYWGEPSDLGQYLFRGRDLIVEQGNVGIGTISPSAKLDIVEAGGSSGNSSAIRLRAGNSSAYTGNNQVLMSYQAGKLYSHAIKTRHHNGQEIGNSIDFYVWQTGDQPTGVGSRHVMSLNGGNVGIGTMDPLSKLAVNGSIRATEVKVLADISVPDYVFESDYELRTLKETKDYIAKNKHLPEIPSAAEIEENGLDLGDMNMRLLKKIEELTLYLIDQNGEIQELKKEVNILKNK